MNVIICNVEPDLLFLSFHKKHFVTFFNVSIWLNHVESQENDVFTTPMFDAQKRKHGITWDAEKPSYCRVDHPQQIPMMFSQLFVADFPTFDGKHLTVSHIHIYYLGLP